MLAIGEKGLRLSDTALVNARSILANGRRVGDLDKLVRRGTTQQGAPQSAAHTVHEAPAEKEGR